MKIALVTPARRGSRSGNRHTALRWAAFLRRAGHEVHVAQSWQPDDRTELMLALHARRSHGSIRAFHERHPSRPLIVALTGTDVYRDIRSSRKAQASLAMAHGFIVLQAEALRELPARLRTRAGVVVQSSDTRLRAAPVKRRFRACVIGHLRAEKDPLRALAALAHVPKHLSLELVQLGEALDLSLGRRARQATRRDSRYRWLGGLPHARALGWLASSHVMIISSRMEGGANVVSEAIRIGVPVIASRIPGNVGLLGRGYPAYFTAGDARSLAAVLVRAATDASFYRALKSSIARLSPAVAPANEARSLVAVITRAARAGNRPIR